MPAARRNSLSVVELQKSFSCDDDNDWHDSMSSSGGLRLRGRLSRQASMKQQRLNLSMMTKNDFRRRSSAGSANNVEDTTSRLRSSLLSSDGVSSNSMINRNRTSTKTSTTITGPLTTNMAQQVESAESSTVPEENKKFADLGYEDMALVQDKEEGSNNKNNTTTSSEAIVKNTLGTATDTEFQFPDPLFPSNNNKRTSPTTVVTAANDQNNNINNTKEEEVVDDNDDTFWEALRSPIRGGGRKKRVSQVGGSGMAQLSSLRKQLSSAHNTNSHIVVSPKRSSSKEGPYPSPKRCSGSGFPATKGGEKSSALENMMNKNNNNNNQNQNRDFNTSFSSLGNIRKRLSATDHKSFPINSNRNGSNKNKVPAAKPSSLKSRLATDKAAAANTAKKLNSSFASLPTTLPSSSSNKIKPKARRTSSRDSFVSRDSQSERTNDTTTAAKERRSSQTSDSSNNSSSNKKSPPQSSSSLSQGRAGRNRRRTLSRESITTTSTTASSESTYPTTASIGKKTDADTKNDDDDDVSITLQEIDPPPPPPEKKEQTRNNGSPPTSISAPRSASPTTTCPSPPHHNHQPQKSCCSCCSCASGGGGGGIGSWWMCQCGYSMDMATMKFCGKCGTPRNWTCTDCHFDQNLCDYVFCGNCGTKRTKTKQQLTTTTTTTTRE